MPIIFISLTIEVTGSSTNLGFVEDLLRDLICENLWWLGLLQNLVLAEREKAFEDILGEGEADDELLPREQGPVQDACKTLQIISYIDQL